MRLHRAVIARHRSIDFLDFRLGPFTVLFGRNNVGKTSVLEALFGTLAPERMADPHIKPPQRTPGIRTVSRHNLTQRSGAVFFKLVDELPSDDEIHVVRHQVEWLHDTDFPALPPDQVAYVSDSWGDDPALMFVDPSRYFSGALGGNSHRSEGDEKSDTLDPWADHEESMKQREHCAGFSVAGPKPESVYLDWDFLDADERVAEQLAAVCVYGHGEQPEWGFLSSGRQPWLEQIDIGDSVPAWRLNPLILERIQRFGRLATELLPDFIDGSIGAKIRFPSLDWQVPPKICVDYRDPRNPDHSDDLVEDYELAELWDERPGHELFGYGRGTLRWIGVAAQLALRIMGDCPSVESLKDAAPGTFSRYVVFFDEPEAHLHPSAVGSIVRWCEQLVGYGFNIVTATHHEEFLRASSDTTTLVHVTREPDKWTTTVRTLPSSATPLLQDLAEEIGMHPASTLSLHRAILFVEGPLDVAVLDEFAGPSLDAAGVTMIPIHGTRNLQGLIDSELTTRLGIKMGILTDATEPTTMGTRSNSKRSSEEVKVSRLLKLFTDRGLPTPTVFGVTEDDLLFALPVDGVRTHVLRGPFPEWKELVAECREATGKGASDSVNWKSFAHERYGLDITTGNGVRRVVHALTFEGVQMPSIRAVVDQVIQWARSG
ncbi:AAA family ATPase [Mycobacterium sp. 852002-51613_SCH5001154]|uniref:AAA family ATPase n=1 Tax=Mycobacterium sp. 852002-51613_SCH5001154 TaxID=1834104 RepID=UPI000B149D89|nr:AAA family ATPase [Mycobacterium sp. 852002-51613_SCH5001154]